MPKAIFLNKTRESLVLAELFPTIEQIAASEAEDQYAVDECRITCRFRIEPGDFVSRQVLGCHNAIRVGTLACEYRELALEIVAEANTVIGIVGPEPSVDAVAVAIASRFGGVIISSTDAQVV